jgi:integrase
MRPKTLSDVSSESVRRYIETRRETEVNGKKLSGKTLRCNLISLQSIFKWAIEEGYYAGLNPAAEARKKVRIKREPRPKVQSLTTGQLTKCLELAKEVDTDTYLAFAIGALGGLRISEVGNLRWEDSIDFDSDTITIEPREEGEDISDFDTKTPGSQRAVPLFAELKEILLPHRQDSGYVVFPNKKFRYPFSLQPQVAAVRKRLKLDWFTFHKLRHTFVSLHLNTHKDLTLEQVSKVLGHRSVAMTADTYMDLLTTEMDKSARLLNGHGIKSGRENIRMRR